MASLSVNDCGESVQDGAPAVLTLTSRHRGDDVLVEVSGEIDLATAPVVEQAIAEAFSTDGHGDGHGVDVVVDLHGVEFMGSTGLSVLLTAQAELAGAGLVLSLVDPSPVVTRTLELAGLADMFTIRSTAPDDDLAPA
jgi:anti-sigma B factor antagonist